MSCCELLLEDVVSDANVFDRPRNSGELDEPSGDVGDGRENVGWEGDTLADESELYD